MAYARHQFAMGKRAPDGSTVRQHLEFALKTAKVPAKRARLVADLAGPPMPTGYRPLWEAFAELGRWRGSGGMGPAALTLHDIREWEARFLPPGARFSADELDVLKQLDHLSLSES